jgi:hypothetical protein
MSGNRISPTTFTIPDGLSNQTPTPVMMDPRMSVPDRTASIGSTSFLAAIAIILGIVISTGTILAVVGKAFYVERPEYNLATIAAAEDKTKVSETLKQMRDTLVRQENSLQKLSDDVDTLKQDLAAIRRRR